MSDDAYLEPIGFMLYKYIYKIIKTFFFLWDYETMAILKKWITWNSNMWNRILLLLIIIIIIIIIILILIMLTSNTTF
jgi:hypothetical protein